jgi:hypothetical protein
MLGIVFFIFMLGVVMPSVVMLIVVAPCKSGFRIDVSFCFWNWFFDTFSFFFEKFSTIFFHQKIQSFLSHFWSKKAFYVWEDLLTLPILLYDFTVRQILGSNISSLKMWLLCLSSKNNFKICRVDWKEKDSYFVKSWHGMISMISAR